MKKTGIILALCLLAAFVSGCDFLRTVAGRPTSEHIEAKRQVVELQEQRIKAAADSAANAERIAREAAEHEVAAAAALDRLNRESRIVPVSRIYNIDKSSLSSRYYVMIGSFSSVENASALAEQIRAAGFEAVLLPYRNGRNAVALDPTDDVVRIEASLRKALDCSFCPADAWILAVE